MSARYMASGSSAFSPSLNAGVGVVGVTMASTLANASSKSRRQQAAHPLRLQVVGVVVAGAENVGAEHDAPLRPRRRSPRRACDDTSRPGSCASRRADSVPHAVVARQVRRSLGGGDQVVRRNRVFRVGQRYRNNLASRPWPVPGCPLPPRCRTSGSRPFTEVFPRHCRSSGLRPAVQSVEVVGHRNVGRGRIQRIASGHGLQHQARCLSRSCRTAQRDRATRRRQSARSARRVRRSASARLRRRMPPADESSRQCRTRSRPPRFPQQPPRPSRLRNRRGRACGRADCAPDESRNSRSTSPWRTRRNWSCPE